MKFIVAISLFLILMFHQVAVSKDLPAFNQRFKTVSGNAPSFGQFKTVTVDPITGPFTDDSPRDVIILGVDQAYPDFIGTTMTVKLKLIVKPFNPNLASYPIYLQVNYHPFDTASYRDQQAYLFSKIYQYRVSIDTIYVNGVAQTTLPKNLYIDASIYVTRWYNFTGNNPTLNINPKKSDCDNYDQELLISWSGTPNAEEYQLEWTFVNDYQDSATFIPAANLKFNFKTNASRVTTYNSSYNIPLLFEHGYLLFRVRTLGRSSTPPHQVLYGNWSVGDKGKVSDFPNYYYRVINPHRDSINWQLATTFAEEGKKKEVISYFDGSLRSRETVTKLNTDSNIIVGQTIYDFQGRPAITVLPVPTGDRCILQPGNQGYINYISQFNKNLGGSGYRNKDFDKETISSCTVMASPMNTISGASNYYSPANPDKSNYQAFVPDAALFPFIQTEFTPDNTGRIRRQGGAGPGFQLGSSHETFYYYGKPQQIEVDRLFGSEAGDASHYQKNMVRDPNGQTSISYLDQEGRVIVTSLAGDTTPGLIGLPSEDNANILLTSDLFNKDADGVSILNNISTTSNSIEFNSQLLVGYTSNYFFSYNLAIDTLDDSCLKDNICFNCIYNLRLKVTDECGLITILDEDTVGHFSKDANGSLVFLSECQNPTSLSVTKTFNVVLQPGNYSISKILTVNPQAKDAFISAYLDTTYNKCVLTLQDFIDDALANLDTSGCHITCDECIQSLGSRDSFVALGYGSALKYDFLAQQCKKPCTYQSNCDMSYQMMLADVSQNGQYGQYLDINGEVDTLISPLSVFNINNELPKQDIANWRHPLITLYGSNYNSYIEEDGELSVIVLSDSSGIYIPLVSDTGLIYYSASGGYHYTYPENLKYVTDFIGRWQSSWALSLVQYHPEYCYYLSCKEYSAPINNSPISSNDFDALLNSADTYDEAVNLHLITTGTSPLDRIYHGWDHAYTSPLWDPFTVAGNYDDDGLELHNRILSYTSINNQSVDMVSFASYEARCNGTGNLTATCANFGGSFGDSQSTTAMRDTEWALLKGVYLSLKSQIQQERAGNYAVALCYGYNGCIGENLWSPYGTPMANSTCPFCPFYDAEQPCSMGTYQLYSGKTRRFIDGLDMAGIASDPQDIAYQEYLISGECPAALNFQYLLNDLASADKLKSTTGVTLTSYLSFNNLYSTIYDFNPPLPIPDWKWTGSTGDVLNFTIKPVGSTLYNGQLDKTGLPITSWSNVKVMKEIHVISYAGGITSFTIWAGLTASSDSLNPYIYYQIPGTINLNLATCQFPESCHPNEFAVDLSVLMSALAGTSKLSSAAIIPLHTAAYTPFLSPSILNSLGSSGHLRWIYKSSVHHFELLDSLSADSIVIEITGTEPSTFNYNLLPSVKYFVGITSDFYNAFSVEGYDVLNNLLVKLSGQVIKFSAGSPSKIKMGDCSLPMPVQCLDPVYETTKQFFDLISDILVNHDISTTQNIFSSLYMTPELSDLFDLITATSSSQYNMDTIGKLFQDSLIFSRICPLVLSHSNKLNPALFMNNITQINGIKLTGSTDGMGNYHEFYLLSTFGPNNISDTVFGSVCIPLRLCDCNEGSNSNNADSRMGNNRLLREEEDSTETGEGETDTLQMAVDSSYTAYSSELDSLYEQINLQQTDLSYIEPLNENEFSAGGFIYSMNTYQRYLNHFQPDIDTLEHINSPASFVLWYGNYVEADKEYNRYLSAINKYNERCSVNQLPAITAIADTDFYNGFYADSIFSYIDYLSAYPQDTITALNAADYRTAHGYSAPDSGCASLYQKYVKAYLQFRMRQAVHTSCWQWPVIAPFYSYQNFLNNNLCCSDSGIAMTIQFINQLNDTTTCPGSLPQMTGCDGEASKNATNIKSCQEAYQNYINAINTYNNSYYATNTGKFLDIIYVTYDAFSNAGLCSCYSAYSKYLDAYLTSTNLQMVGPQNISEYCLPIPVTSCEIAYADYINASMTYDDAILHNNLDLPMIDQTYQPDLFQQKGFCDCSSSFAGFLNAILSGAVPNSPDLYFEINNYFVTCHASLIPPCAGDFTNDTIYDVPFSDKEDPCVAQLISTAIYNATDAYQEYKDSLTGFISNAYSAHCLKPFESFDATYQFKEYHYTLYYYDAAGNLVKTVPPEGVLPVGVTSSYDPVEQKIIADRTNNTHTIFTNHGLSTLYKYNSLNQLISESLPDQDKMNIFEPVVPGGIHADLQVTAIQFVSENKGFLAGFIDYGLNGGKRGAFYTTTDGGFTWQFSSTVPGSNLKKIFWVTKDTGYAVGSEGTLIKTMDGGQNWDLLNTYIDANNDTCIFDFNDLYFSNSKLGYIAGKNGRIVKTSDGGTTFTSLNIGQSKKDEIRSITADGNLVYFALAEYYPGVYPSSASRIMHINKTNGMFGMDTICPLNPYHIRYYGKGKAYAAGISGSLSKRIKLGSVFYWIGIGTKLKRDIRDIDFINDSVGVALVDSNEAGGGNIYGQIYGTIDGGVNWKLLSDTGKYYTSWCVFNSSSGIHKLVAVGWKGEVVKISYFPDSNFGLIKLERIELNASQQLTAVWAVEHGNNLYVVTGGNSGKYYFNSNANYFSGEWIASPGTQPRYIKAMDFYTGGTWDISGVIVSYNDSAYGFKVTSNSIVSLTPHCLSAPVKKSIVSAELDPVKKRIIMYDFTHKKFTYAVPHPMLPVVSETTINNLNSFPGFNPVLYYFAVNNDTIIGSTIGGNFGELIMGQVNSTNDNVKLYNETPRYRSPVLADIQKGFGNIFAVGKSGTVLLATSANNFSSLVSKNMRNLNAIKLNNETDGYVVSDSGGIYQMHYSQVGFNSNLLPLDLVHHEDLLDLAIYNSTVVYAVGRNGTMLYSATGAAPFSKIFNNNLVDLYAVAIRPNTNNAWIAGDHSQLFLAVDGLQVQLQNIYLRSIPAFHFTDLQNGYLVSDNFNVRQTHDGGNTWNVVTPASSLSAYPTLLCMKSLSPVSSVAAGNSRKYVQITDRKAVISTFNMPLAALNNAATNILGLGVSSITNEVKFMIARNTTNTNGYFLTKGVSWSVDTAYANPAYPKALWVFRNDNVILAGTRSLLYFYDGIHTHNIYPSGGGFPSNISLNAVGFYDDINGYVAGEKGFIIKTKNWGFSSYPQFKILYGPAATWEIKPTNDNLANQVNQNNITINALGVPGRWSVMTGGSYFPLGSAHAGYSRIVHDESLVFSTRNWFDRNGRMVLSQNTKQFNHSPKQYSYSLYDALGRLIEVGVKNENVAPVFATVFGAFVGTSYNINVIDDSKLTTWLNVSPATSRYEVIHSFYDAPIAGLPGSFMQENLRKRIATITYQDTFKTSILSYGYASHYSYDIHGNVKTLFQDNPMMGIPSQRYKRFDYFYDLISGKVNEVDYEKDSVDQWDHRYVYDADNRIRTVETSNNHLIWDRDAKYFYYQHGPLAREEVGMNKVQGIDYVYTLQGWLKGINSTTLDSARDVGQDGFASSVNSQFAPDVFSYSLGYYQNDYTPITPAKWTSPSRFISDPWGSQIMDNRDDLFNGNITYMMTSIKNPVTGDKLPQATAYKYDQLNRLMAERAFNNINLSANKWQAGSVYNNRFFNAFTYDANGNILTQKRYDGNNTQVENLTYQYYKNVNGNKMQNRLYMIDDAVASGLFSDDIDDQGTMYDNADSVNILNNYSYTELGELKKDAGEQIANMVWKGDGKVKEINRNAGSAKKNLKFSYDPMGNRIAKHIYSSNNVWQSSTYYVRDAQGNIMATYDKTVSGSILSYKVSGREIYGSSRLGNYGERLEMIGATADQSYFAHFLGKKAYEGVNHLGNVLTVFTDRKFPKNSNGHVSGFKGEISVSEDYYPFGATMPGRSFSAFNYRFGFSGQEKDDEVKGAGNSLSFDKRIYDPRTGRFSSSDPLERKYAWNSPYCYAMDRVIDGNDLEGCEWVHYLVKYTKLDGQKVFQSPQVLKDWRHESEAVMNKMHGYGQMVYSYNGQGDVFARMIPSFYSKYSQGFGPLGEGAQYTYQQVGADGNNVGSSTDQMEVAPSPIRHGMYSGPGAKTIYGPGFHASSMFGQYDFKIAPIDMEDAIAREHDREENVPDFASWTDLKWIGNDIRFVRRLNIFITASKDPNYIDPFTGRKPSEEAVSASQNAYMFFNLIIAMKEKAIGEKWATEEMSNMEYEGFLKLITDAQYQQISTPTPQPANH